MAIGHRCAGDVLIASALPRPPGTRPRLRLVALCPLSAIDQVWHRRTSLAQTKKSGLPGGKAMLVAARLTEATTPLMILRGGHDRLGAFLLAGFCVMTSRVRHRFWYRPDFLCSANDSRAHGNFGQFLKSFGLAGGSLVLVFAGALTGPPIVSTDALGSSLGR